MIVLFTFPSEYTVAYRPAFHLSVFCTIFKELLQLPDSMNQNNAIMKRKIAYVFLLSCLLSSCVVTCKHQGTTGVPEVKSADPVKEVTQPPISLDTGRVNADTTGTTKDVDSFRLPISDSMIVH